MAGASLKTKDGAVDAGSVDFAHWLPTGFVRVAVTRQHGQWYATATDFDIAGVGPDEGAAYRNLSKLVTVYLRSYYDDGRPYEDAIRRSPRPLPASGALHIPLNASPQVPTGPSVVAPD